MTPLLDLHEAVLDGPALDQLLADLAGLTEVIETLTKSGPRDYAASQPVALHAGFEALRSGVTRCLQIRYRYEDAQWWDTLIAVPQGFRLVRMRREFE